MTASHGANHRRRRAVRDAPNDRAVHLVRRVAAVLMTAVLAAGCGAPGTESAEAGGASPEEIEALAELTASETTTPPETTSASASQEVTTPGDETTTASADNGSGARGLQGRVTIDRDYVATFALLEDGSYRVDSPRGVATFDAKTLRIEVDRPEGGTIVVDGNPPAGPDRVQAHLVSTLRTDLVPWSVDVIERDDAESTSRLERPALEWSSSYSGERDSNLVVVVDEETMLPLDVTVTSPQRAETDTWQVDDLEAVDIGRDRFTQGIGSEQAGGYRDIGFRPVTLEEAAARAGYAPLLPAWIPEGFMLASVVYADEPESDSNLNNPPSQRVIVAEYRKGFRSFAVTTRAHTVEYLRGNSGETRPWKDLYCIGYDCGPTEMIDVGGNSWSVVAGPVEVTHAWGMAGDLVVTVGGDLSQSEVISIATSLPVSR